MTKIKRKLFWKAALDCLTQGATSNYGLPFLTLYLWNTTDNSVTDFNTHAALSIILSRGFTLSNSSSLFVKISLVSCLFFKLGLRLFLGGGARSRVRELRTSELLFTMNSESPVLVLIISSYKSLSSWIKHTNKMNKSSVVSCNGEKKQGKETDGRKNNKDTQTVLKTLLQLLKVVVLAV